MIGQWVFLTSHAGDRTDLVHRFYLLIAVSCYFIVAYCILTAAYCILPHGKLYCNFTVGFPSRKTPFNVKGKRKKWKREMNGHLIYLLVLNSEIFEFSVAYT